MSASLIIPTSLPPSMTGSRRICCDFIMASASAMSASASTTCALPEASEPAVTSAGSCPAAIAFTTMSRSVSMPVTFPSAVQIGSAPTFSLRISCAARSSVSVAGMHWTLAVIMSRAVVIFPP
jgi:hypothetical protein